MRALHPRVPAAAPARPGRAHAPRVDHGERDVTGQPARIGASTSDWSDPATMGLYLHGDAGAIVVLTPPRLDGTEIEIRPEGSPWSGAHAAVRERRSPDGVRYAGVFPRLDAGGYELRVLGGRNGVILPISVTAGTVVETWLDAPVE